MFFNTGRYGENIRIENNVRWIHADSFSQNPERALANVHFAIDVVGLTIFVESHDNNRGTIITHETCLLDKLFLAFFQTDRVDDCFALHAM